MSDTRTVINAVVEAHAAGEDLGLAAFLTAASPSELRLACLLSCVIVVSDEEAVRIAQQVWPTFDASALDDIRRRPFVEQVHGGLRLTQRWSKTMSTRFKTTDVSAFRQVHQLLADAEHTSLDSEEDPDNRWFIRGRTAFYLAGLDPSQSVSEFGEVFTTPPVVERTARRLWLAALVERQSSLLSAEEREVAFFRGFAHYVQGRQRDARPDFERVVASDQRDRYRAVALHLLGSMQRGRDSGLALLRESVTLSSQLGIAENEIMARHTLSWALAVRAQSSPTEVRTALIDESHQLAASNRDRAVSTGDEYLIAWCSRTDAAIEWLRLTEFRSSVDNNARQRAGHLVDVLNSASRLALAIGELETACLAANDTVAIWRDIGAVDAAIAEATEFLDALGPIGSPPPALGNLAKTLGSMGSLTADASQSLQLRSLRERVDWVQSGRRPDWRRRPKRRL